MEILRYEVYNLEWAVAAAGNSMSLEARTPDVLTEHNYDVAHHLSMCGGGSGHSNFRKGILVAMDVRYSQYWSMQAQRYGHFDIVSSTSKMHCITKMDIAECCNEYVTSAAKRNLIRCIDRYKSYCKLIADMNANDGGVTPEMIAERDRLFHVVLSNVPMGMELEMHVVTNYEQLATMYRQRKCHRTEDWKVFCKWIEQLPKAKEFILCDRNNLTYSE